MGIENVLKNLDDKFKEVSTGTERIWKGPLITFDKFVTDDYHMAFPPLSEKQKRAVLAVLGEDPEKVFEKIDYQEAVLLWGKGSGKDSICALIISYIIYLLLNLENPQKYFYAGVDGRYPIGEAIDVVNVALSAEQAQNVFFDKFRQRILNWKWLQDRYRVKVSGKPIDPSKSKNMDLQEVLIGTNAIVFPGNIRAFSRHSQQETTEGLNILIWVMDEAAAFTDHTHRANADKMYGMLKSSANSRFPDCWRGFIISFPRHEDDFMMRQYDASFTELHTYADRGATWEVNPTKTREDFVKEYEKDAEDARCKYECIPPKQKDAFISFPERIREAIGTRVFIADYDDVIINVEGNRFVGKALRKYNIPRQPDTYEYVLFGDLGLTTDTAVISIGHRETEKIVIDLILQWIPLKDRKLPVSLTNIKHVIFDLKHNLVNITKAGFDRWNSAEMIQDLQKEKIQADFYRVTTQDYLDLRQLIYSRGIELLDYPPMVRELEKLQLIGGVKVDHIDTERKDISDTLAGLVKLLTTVLPQPARKHLPSPEESEPIEEREGDKSFPGLGAEVKLR